MLHYERLDVYQCATQLARISFKIVARLPQGNADLGDQLKRAITSILLNIAEGAGKSSLRDRARFYMTARGSAMECNALFDVLHLMSLTGDQVTREAKDLTERITAMLTKMTRS